MFAGILLMANPFSLLQSLTYLRTNRQTNNKPPDKQEKKVGLGRLPAPSARKPKT
ncbi:hypothetical protein THTE_2387 [Thermogutta terrifontis]|uniref:Uncharacterized protein n=1 Tax=Thermogutta terrifontis TaxID=1331910 RepID=A0A286RG98_9BACT|nr:hypothetical protein THTE_2387 [Thermogutta terrifontis]